MKSLVVCFVASAVMWQAGGQKPSFRAESRLVPVYVSVTDRDGTPISELTQSDFDLRVDGKAVGIEAFSVGSDDLTLTAMFQTAFGSRGHADPPDDEVVRLAALALIDALREGDRLRIGSYGVEVVLSPLLTGNKAVLRRVVDEELWVRRGWSPLWGAAGVALASMKESVNQKSLVVFGDGINSAQLTTEGWTTGGGSFVRVKNAVTSKDIADLALRNHATVHAVSLGPGGINGELKGIVKSTGGLVLELGGRKDYESAISLFMESLHEQYLLGFASPVDDGRVHKISVRVRRSGASVRSRTSFVAPERSER